MVDTTNQTTVQQPVSSNTDDLFAMAEDSAKDLAAENAFVDGVVQATKAMGDENVSDASQTTPAAPVQQDSATVSAPAVEQPASAAIPQEMPAVQVSVETAAQPVQPLPSVDQPVTPPVPVTPVAVEAPVVPPVAVSAETPPAVPVPQEKQYVVGQDAAPAAPVMPLAPVAPEQS